MFGDVMAFVNIVNHSMAGYGAHVIVHPVRMIYGGADMLKTVADVSQRCPDRNQSELIKR